MAELVVRVLIGGNEDALSGFSRKQSLRKESPCALLLLYQGAEMRSRRRKQGREGNQCDGVVDLATAVCSSLLHLWGKMHLRSVALSCGSGKGILISPWSKVHPQDVNSTTISRLHRHL